MTIERIGLVVHAGKPAAVAAAQRVRQWAHTNGVSTADVDVWKELDGKAARCSAEEAAAAGYPDLIVTVGGDGTFLRGARVAAASNAEVLGIDVGRVGFLTEVALVQLEPALTAVHAGAAQIERRLTLTMRASRPLEIPPDIQTLLRYGRGPTPAPPPVRSSSAQDVGWGVGLEVTAINDVVFEKLARDRQASLGLSIGGRPFASYSLDAMVVASATGSTAYSFAAGGPVLSPRLDALVVTPVAPHMVFDRSLVLAADEVASVRVLDRSGQVVVTVDGQLVGVLDPGDWAAVYAGPHPCRVVRLGPSDFFGRLRERFGLADAAAAVADGQTPLAYRPSAPIPAELRHLHLPPPAT